MSYRGTTGAAAGRSGGLASALSRSKTSSKNTLKVKVLNVVKSASPTAASAGRPRTLGAPTKGGFTAPEFYKRGTKLVVEVKGAPNAAKKKYDFEDVCRVGQMILDRRLILSKPAFKKAGIEVPYSSAQRWCMDDDVFQRKYKNKRGAKGTPHWKVERDIRRRKSLPQNGPGTTLGAAEDVIMMEISTSALRGFPWLEEDMEEVIRDTLVELKIKNPRTGKLCK